MPTTQTNNPKNSPVEWYKISAKSETEAEILIYEEIGQNWFGGGIGAKQFAKDLKALGEVKHITTRINSPGGSVFEGTAIYNTLRAHKAKKTMIVDGLAASIASVILMAGDEIIMPANSMVMIHDPWMFTMGNAEEMRKAADMLDKIKESILTSYRRSGQDDATLAKMMADETWMTADDAVELGFADKTTEPVKAVAFAFDLSKFRNVPEFLKNQAVNIEPAASEANESVNDKGEESVMPITMDQLKNEAPDLLTSIQDAAKKEAQAEIKAQIEEAVKADRERMQAIDDNTLAGNEKLASECKIDGTSVADFALKQVALEKKRGSKVLAELKEDAPDPVKPASAEEKATDDKDSTEEIIPQDMAEAKKIYAENAQIRKVYSCAENFFYDRKNRNK